MHKTLLLTIGALFVGLSAYAANADLLVYEGFQYETAQPTRTGADLLDGQADDPGLTDTDATGIGGTWTDVLSANGVGNLFMAEGSLSFGDLPTNGNHVRSDTNLNNDIFVRPVTSDLDGSAKLWFSFLSSKLLNNNNAAEGGVAITNQNVSSAQLQSITSPGGLQGFAIAPTTSGNNWSGWAWDGTNRVDVGGSYSVPTNGTQTDLLIGEISFGTGTGGTDEFSVYYYTLNAGSIIGGSLNQIGSTIEVDVDESALDTLNVTRQVNTAYDEIRIADNFAEAIGVPEPASMALLAMGGLMVAGRRRE